MIPITFTSDVDSFSAICPMRDTFDRFSGNSARRGTIVEFMEQISKSKFKYSATISDPLDNCEIDLLLFLNSNENPPKKGTIGILHNFHLYKQNNILRLNSTYRSYFLEETKCEDELTRRFKEMRSEREWDNFLYRNLSSVAFSYRSIHDLREIYRITDDERTYSLIE